MHLKSSYSTAEMTLSASEMTYIVSGGAINSTHSLTLNDTETAWCRRPMKANFPAGGGVQRANLLHFSWTVRDSEGWWQFFNQSINQPINQSIKLNLYYASHKTLSEALNNKMMYFFFCICYFTIFVVFYYHMWRIKIFKIGIRKTIQWLK